MSSDSDKPSFGTPVHHNGHWVSLISQVVNHIDGLPPYDAPRDVPMIYNSVTERGNIEVRLIIRINGKRFQVASRNTTTARSHQSSDKYSSEEMREWLDYAVRLKTVYLAAHDEFIENNEYPGDYGDPYSGFNMNLIGRNLTDHPLSDKQLELIGREQAKRTLTRRAEHEHYDRLEHTWKYKYWTPGGKITKEVVADSREEADEKAREQGIDVEDAEVQNAAHA